MLTIVAMEEPKNIEYGKNKTKKRNCKQGIFYPKIQTFKKNEVGRFVNMGL